METGVLKQRFKVKAFKNKRTGSQSLMVTGIKRDGTRIRENYMDPKAAQCRHTELEAEYWTRVPSDTALRTTTMTDTQVKIAEIAFRKLESDDDLLRAVEHWLTQGQHTAPVESPRLDDAVQEFISWLESEASLRPHSKRNLKLRVSMFRSSVGNLRVNEITPEFIDGYLDKRSVSAATKDNDKRAISRFFSWCADRKRRWTTSNPCSLVRIEHGDKAPPAVLTVDECEKLLRKAEEFKDGRLLTYTVVCLFAGLRPFEASRLTWEQVNLVDGELRMERRQTKTGRGRVIGFSSGPAEQKPFNVALARWLKVCKGKPFYPPNWQKDFAQVKLAAGFGGRTSDEKKGLKPWTADIMRHTAISHYFRLTGSYGRAAEMFDNSEAIIKSNYQGRVTSEDTRAFYALAPAVKKR